MQRQENSTFTVENIITVDSLPSGSGLAMVNSLIFAIGDDSPYLFQLTKDYAISEKHLLLPEWSGLFKIPKGNKPDFESLATADWHGQPALIILGSGSKAVVRDSMLVVRLDDLKNPMKFSLSSLFEAIVLKEGIDRESLNIEGAVTVGENLWLFNRGRNSIITLPWQQLVSLVENNKVPDNLPLEVHVLQLPQIRGKQARFSGACGVPGTNKVLFTASVEDTENWIDDGEILGSFVGMIDENSLKQEQVLEVWQILDRQGAALVEKLESIEVLEVNGNSLKALAITDDDKGGSKLLELSLTKAAHLFKR